MSTLIIKPPKHLSLEKAKAALENLDFEIVTNEYTEPYAKVSEAELRSIDEGLEEAKKGVFIPHNEVMKGLRELIENWKNGRSNDYFVAKS